MLVTLYQYLFFFLSLLNFISFNAEPPTYSTITIFLLYLGWLPLTQLWVKLQYFYFVWAACLLHTHYYYIYSMYFIWAICLFYIYFNLSTLFYVTYRCNYYKDSTGPGHYWPNLLYQSISHCSTINQSPPFIRSFCALRLWN